MNQRDVGTRRREASSHAAPEHDPGPDPHPGQPLLARAAAGLLVLLLGAWYPVMGGLTVATILVLALAPVILPAVRRFRGGTALLGGWLATIAAGLVLAFVSSADHTVVPHLTRDTSLHLLGIALGVPAVLWARTMLRDGEVALLFGAGMLLSAGANLSASNPWKFSLAVPVSIVLLALAWLTGRWLVEAAALGVVAALSVVNDSRSMFGLAVMAGALVVWQAGLSRWSRRGTAVRTFVLLAVLGVGAYQLGQALALEGVLGTAAAERSERQIATSGSLLVGSRPEMGATSALVGHRPEGFGLGVLVRGDELAVAKSGMAELGYDPNNGYVERYMFGQGVELHSFVGNLWAWCGLVGVLMGMALLVLVVRGLVTRLADRTASGLVVLLCVRSLWDLFFAPIYSTMVFFTLLLGLLLVPVARRSDPPPG